jgi:hypothetical protein
MTARKPSPCREPRSAARLACGPPRDLPGRLARHLQEAPPALPALDRGGRGTPVLGLGRRAGRGARRRPDAPPLAPRKPTLGLVGGQQGDRGPDAGRGADDGGGRGGHRGGGSQRNVGVSRRCRAGRGARRPRRSAGRAAAGLGWLAAQRHARHAGMDQDGEDRADARQTHRGCGRECPRRASGRRSSGDSPRALAPPSAAVGCGVCVFSER